jgi:hypothetical protein
MVASRPKVSVRPDYGWHELWKWLFISISRKRSIGLRRWYINITITILDIGVVFFWSSSCGRQSVDQYVWVSGLLLGSLTRFYLALLLSVDNYVVLLSMRPLWRENGSVIYCKIASGQSNHTWAEVPQNSRPYHTVSSDNPPTWRARFPYLYPQEQGGPVIPPGTGFPFCRLLRLRVRVRVRVTL